MNFQQVYESILNSILNYHNKLEQLGYGYEKEKKVHEGLLNHQHAGQAALVHHTPHDSGSLDPLTTLTIGLDFLSEISILMSNTGKLFWESFCLFLKFCFKLGESQAEELWKEVHTGLEMTVNNEKCLAEVDAPAA